MIGLKVKMHRNPNPQKLKSRMMATPNSMLRSFLEKMAKRVSPMTMNSVSPAAVSTKGPPQQQAQSEVNWLSIQEKLRVKRVRKMTLQGALRNLSVQRMRPTIVYMKTMAINITHQYLIWNSKNGFTKQDRQQKPIVTSSSTESQQMYVPAEDTPSSRSSFLPCSRANPWGSRANLRDAPQLKPIYVLRICLDDDNLLLRNIALDFIVLQLHAVLVRVGVGFIRVVCVCGYGFCEFVVGLHDYLVLLHKNQWCLFNYANGNHSSFISACALVMNSSGSGAPQTRNCCAISRICLHRSTSSRLNSKEANSIHGVGRLEKVSQYFSQICLTLSSWHSCSSSQMQALNTFSLGHSPIARPYTFLAFARSLHLRQKLAQKIHSLPKVNFLCGTSFNARSQTCSALAMSPAISSQKMAQLNQMYMYLLQNRFSSAGGFSFSAASYTSRIFYKFLKDYSRKMRFSQAQQLSGFFAICSLYRLRLSPRTTSSISYEVPCSFSKLRQSSYSFFAWSFGTCFSPNLKICLARSYSLSLIQNLANSRKQFSLSAQDPSSVMILSQILLVASFSLFLNSNLATLRQVSRVGKVSKQRQSTFFARSGSPMRSSNLMKAIQAFSPGHHSIHLSKTSLVLTYSPISSSMYAYLNQN